MLRPSILIIDDDADLSEMLQKYLEGEGFAVQAEQDGVAGLQRAQGGCDAVILDVMMPGMSGIEVLRNLREASSVPILMLTAKGDQVDRVIGLELGADDYVAKPFYPREVVARLRAVLRRNRPPTSEQASLSSGKLELHTGARKVTWDGRLLELTATEFSMLHILLLSGESVATKDDLSLKVLGRKREVYDRSVDVHMSNLRLKMQRASNSSVAIETIRGIGYRLLVNSETKQS